MFLNTKTLKKTEPESLGGKPDSFKTADSGCSESWKAFKDQNKLIN
jgi:hypothetical protein